MTEKINFIDSESTYEKIKIKGEKNLMNYGNLNCIEKRNKQFHLSLFCNLLFSFCNLKCRYFYAKDIPNKHFNMTVKAADAVLNFTFGAITNGIILTNKILNLIKRYIIRLTVNNSLCSYYS